MSPQFNTPCTIYRLVPGIYVGDGHKIMCEVANRGRSYESALLWYKRRVGWEARGKAQRA
jgi:hypothetical protein